MKTETTIVIGILVAFFLLILIWKIKDNAYNQGFKRGENEVIKSIFSTSTWLGTLPNKTSYNTLFLFASTYMSKRYVNADSFRKKILELDETKRVSENPASIT